MSGIAGICNLDGAPIDRLLLRQLTDSLAARGPDAQTIWSHGSVGLGHALLRTTFEAAREQQPCSLDGQVWITADARVDGRTELIGKLAGTGCRDLAEATDPELILHAYHAWGEDCLQHLLGDFAFAIWDERRRRLFCARDQFGVKPFYFARVKDGLVFSNTLNTIRFHPAVSNELNELAIADFLLFDCNQDQATTTFADIRRLPPAHALTWSATGLQLRRYWTLPTDGQIRYRRSRDYVEHFLELLQVAVADRLRTDRVGIFMSGGLDSPAVAATALELRDKGSTPLDLQAYTVVYDRLIPDEERHYSGLAARTLGIPIHYLAADDYQPYERWDQPELLRPEPHHEYLSAIIADQFRQLERHSRVALTGYGGDPALHATTLVELVQCLPLGRVVADVGRYLCFHRQLPPLGLRSRLKHWLGKRPKQLPYPVWLNPAFADHWHLRDRWAQGNLPPAPIHPVRSRAARLLTSKFWPSHFETYDPGMTQFPVESRHPFFDLRLVTFLLAVPPLPWFAYKELLRVAMHGRLPEAIRLRPKTPLAGHPELEMFRRPGAEWLDRFEPVPELARFVERKAIPPIIGGQDSNQLWVNLRPLSLDYWLRYRQSIGGHMAAVKPSAIAGETRRQEKPFLSPVASRC
jgi:asparagine synthase (glutamine-hydrolysing)